jgi:hypothetical protein
MLPARTEEKPLLQGWALVDNTTEDDWVGVRLSLVAGPPISFCEAGRKAPAPVRWGGEAGGR